MVTGVAKKVMRTTKFWATARLPISALSETLLYRRKLKYCIRKPARITLIERGRPYFSIVFTFLPISSLLPFGLGSLL